MRINLYRKRPGGIVSFVIFLVVVTIFASGAVAVYTIFMKPENQSTVPLLVGNSTVAAVSEAQNLGLIVQLEPVASTMPEGRVLAQSPQAGETLRKGQVIVLQVSQGGELHPIPDVKGKTLAAAQEEIKAQGFALGDVIRINEANIKAGTVIAQSPAAPANVASGRKIDLLVQAGTAQAESITIPDVNRMTESEARNILEAGGVKIQGIDRVYSPVVPEGLAIETRPGAGTLLKPGQGVILKIATQRRPAGYNDATSRTTANQNQNARGSGTVTTPRNTAANTQTQPQTQAQAPAQTSANNNRGVSVAVGGEDEVFIGDNYVLTPTATTANNNSQTSRTTQASTPANTQPQTQTSSQPQASTPASTNSNSEQNQTSAASGSSGTSGGKTARIRYQVPPIAYPMDLRIEITDPNGTRNVMSRQVRSGESINTTASYSQECIIKIYLGGESVWQERQR